MGSIQLAYMTQKERLILLFKLCVCFEITHDGVPDSSWDIVRKSEVQLIRF